MHGVTSFPVLWVGLYALWLLFDITLALWLLPLSNWAVRFAAALAAAMLPPGLLWASERGRRAYLPPDC